jgi:hypothetical protein
MGVRAPLKRLFVFIAIQQVGIFYAWAVVLTMCSYKASLIAAGHQIGLCRSISVNLHTASTRRTTTGSAPSSRHWTFITPT